MKKYKIEFKYDYKLHLDKLFKGINDKDYIWYFEFEEIHKEKSGFLFEEEIFNNQEFWNIILNNKNYYIIHMHLFLYENEEQKAKDIPIFEIDLVDCVYADIYFNDENIEKKLRKNIDEILKNKTN